MSEIILSGRQAQILIQLRTGSWTTNDLASLFEMQNTNVSRELKKFRDLKFIESRKNIGGDTRVFYHHLTKLGRISLDEIFDNVSNHATLGQKAN